MSHSPHSRRLVRQVPHKFHLVLPHTDYPLFVLQALAMGASITLSIGALYYAGLRSKAEDQDKSIGGTSLHHCFQETELTG